VSQAEGFNDNDTDIAVTRPSMPATTRRNGASDPAAAEGTDALGPAIAANHRDNRWPRWPTAWPDGSRWSR
jgi:hypothetical protein